jgi:hypothetical protein
MAQIKSYDTFSDVKDHIKTGRILSKGTNLTVASGAITVTDSYHLVGGEGGNADALTDINGGTQAGQLLLIQNSASANITVTHNSSKIVLAGAANFVLVEPVDTLTLVYDGAKWVEISRSDNS